MDRARSLLCICLLLHYLITTVHASDVLGMKRGYRDPVHNLGRCTLSFQMIEVQKGVVLASGRAAVCYGTATASACDGECASHSASSIHDPAGFNKKCTCCRETQMTSQMITLSPCFDPNDGEVIQGEEFADEYQQPSGCECQPCTL